MSSAIATLKTDPDLLRLLEKARNHIMSPQEAYDNRVSFIFGFLPMDSTITKEDIKAHLAASGIHDPSLTRSERTVMPPIQSPVWDGWIRFDTDCIVNGVEYKAGTSVGPFEKSRETGIRCGECGKTEGRHLDQCQSGQPSRSDKQREYREVVTESGGHAMGWERFTNDQSETPRADKLRASTKFNDYDAMLGLARQLERELKTAKQRCDGSDQPLGWVETDMVKWLDTAPPGGTVNLYKDQQDGDGFDRVPVYLSRSSTSNLGEQQAEAWLAVCSLMNEIAPDWHLSVEGSGQEKMLSFLRSAITRSATSFPCESCKTPAKCKWHKECENAPDRVVPKE